ncbi:MAG: TolC family protein, partial [Bacteriovoracaceae bacterium]
MKWILFIFPYFAGLAMSLAPDMSLAQDVSLEEVEKELESEGFAPEKEAMTLTLQEAIARGLRKNSEQKIRAYQKEIVELNWKDAYEGFWFPQLSLTLNTSNHQVDSVYQDQENAQLPKTPSGFVGLEFEEYTIFNWGKDYLEYLNHKAVYKRQNQELKEKKRALRFQIINQYFNLSRFKNIRSVKKSQLRHTSFIYRLSKEKLALGKIHRQEYLQAKGEFLRSHQEFQEVNAQVAVLEQAMAELLGDDLATTYSLANQLKFVPLNIQKEESLNFAHTAGPDYRQA